MRSIKRNVRVKGVILSSFLVGILFTYNNCSRVVVRDGDVENSSSISFDTNASVKEYLINLSDYELRFRGAKLDNKVYSISNLRVYPHTDSFSEVVFFEKGRESSFPLKVNASNPTRDTSLLRLKSENSKMKVFLR